jgi:hypothetical protein
MVGMNTKVAPPVVSKEWLDKQKAIYEKAIGRE